MKKKAVKPMTVEARYALYYTAEDKEDYLIALRGIDYYCALWDLSQKLRTECKYGKHPRFYEKLREKFYEILDENDVSLY